MPIRGSMKLIRVEETCVCIDQQRVNRYFGRIITAESFEQLNNEGIH